MTDQPIDEAALLKEEKKRLIFIALFIFILFSMLIAQFYTIQIIEGEKWLKQARKQHYFVIKEPFIRGTFYSNPYVKKGHPSEPQRFVIDVPKFHLFADPKSIPQEHKNEISKILSGHLGLSQIEQQNLRNQLDRKTRSRKLSMWLNKERQETINAWWKTYARYNKIPRNALFFVKDYQRSYPFGKLLGQVLHTIRNQKEENTFQAMPTGGLEHYFNHFLKGKQGRKRLMRSPLHALETGEVVNFPENGADIYLTINPYLQAIAEEEIEKGVKKSKALSGWAVMMDPHTGEILALAQYPNFYPPDYQKYFNDPKYIEHTKVKAVTDANEPGSVMKPFTIAIALKANKILKARGEKELFSPEEKIATLSGRFPGRSKPIVDTRPTHFLNLDMAMQRSSNIYMARLAERIISRLGNNWYRQELELLGFGQKSGIELPAESPGVLPTPGKLHPNGSLEWSVPTPFSLSFGHNIQMNSVQLIRAFAALANGGYLVKPTLVRRIVKTDSSGFEEVLLDHTSEERLKSFPRIFDQDISERVIQSMRFVTQIGGTATKANIHGYTEAGKTSTPKKIINGAYSEVRYCPLFVGFTPAKNAAFILAVVMDEPEYSYIPGIGKNHNGGHCTANVFREIATRSLKYLGIPPDDPYGYPYGDPRYNPDKAIWIKEAKKLKEKFSEWNEPKTQKK